MAEILQGQAAEDLLLLIRDDLKACEETEREQRLLEREDNAFASGGMNQWPADVLRDYAGIEGISRSRVTLTFNTVKPPMMQVSNAARAARMGIVAKPKGSKASKKQALYRQGVMRQIEIDSVAPAARIWALDRALRSGRAYYRLLIDYNNDGDFERDIQVKRILDQDSVFLDHNIEVPTGEDAEWATIKAWLTRRQYLRDYGDGKLATAANFEGFSSDAYDKDWVDGNGESAKILVAEHYRAHYDRKTLIQLSDGRAVLQDDLDRKDRSLKQDEREIYQRRIVWYKVNATEILEQRDIPGPYIPIVMLIGEEEFVNGKHIYKGLVRDAKDPARSYNYMRSKQVEAIGLAPVSPWVLAEGQDKNYKEQWRTANTRAWDALRYTPVTFGGELAPPPTRNVVEPAIQAITLAAHEARQDVKDITGFGDPGLGHGNPNEKSGKAIIALQRQSELGSSNYIDNLQRAMTYEAKIMNAWLKFVYREKGRILRIIDEEDQSSSIMLGQPFVRDKEGQPVPHTSNGEGLMPASGFMGRMAQAVGIGGRHSPPPQQPPSGGQDQEPEFVDFSEGEYSITVTVGKSHQTQREEEDESIGALIDAVPALAPLIADLWIENKDFKSAQRIAKRLKRALPPGAAEPEDGQPKEVPPEIQQKMQMLEQQNQQLTQALKTESDAVKTDQAKAAANAQVVQFKAQADAEIQKLKLANDLEIARLKALTDLRKTQIAVDAQMAKANLEADIRLLEQQTDLAHEQRMSDSNRRHELGMTAATSVLESEQADAAARRQAALAEQGAGHEADAAARQAEIDAAATDQAAGHQAALVEQQVELTPVDGENKQ
jgi:hypothetical protein